MVIEENLPFRFVIYPEFYGVFIGFKEFRDSEIFFCSCMYEAIENYIEIRKSNSGKKLRFDREDYDRFKEDNSFSAFTIGKDAFPVELIMKLINDEVIEDESIINHLNFKDKICHKCNSAVPAKQYCHPMYGGKFVQKYGWYIDMKRYELGLNKNYTFDYLEKVPEEIIELSSFTFFDLYKDLQEYYAKEIQNLPFICELLEYLDIQYNLKGDQMNKKEFLYSDEDTLVLNYFKMNFCRDCKKREECFSECIPQIGNDFKPHVYYGEQCMVYKTLIEKVISKKLRKIRSIIENEVRAEVGVKKIGESWTSETILYTIVRRIYEGHEIIRHYRPGILEHLELDIYIKDLEIGIEYQGIQHFKPVKHWGGKEALEKTKARDKRKRELCKTNGIKLVYVYYYDDLSEDLVRKRISDLS